MSITVAEIVARARTLATQAGGTDPNMAAQIDAKGGLFALIPHVILEVYRRKSADINFVRSITVKNTIAMVAGVGAVPTGIMRELLHQSNITDEDNSLVTYYNFASDYNSGQNFDQLGYVVIVGDNFYYTAPAPTTSYTGDLYVTTPTTPTVTTTVTFPDEATTNDVIVELALAIQGKPVDA